ncbi:MAG: YfhO family protein [Patescibacteria group bacterium]|jgi:hypothetical protein
MSSALTNNKLQWLWAGLIISGVTLFLFAPIFKNQTPFATQTLGQIMPLEKSAGDISLLRDSLVQGYPYHKFAAEQIQKGHFPFWNNLIFAGTPFFANGQSAVLSPIKLPFWWLDAYTSFIITLLLQFLVAGLGMFALGRALGWKFTSALISALVLVLSSQFLLRSTLDHMSSVIAWLPWLLYAIYNLQKTLKIKWLLLTSMFIAFVFLSGHFQYAIFCFGLSIIWLMVFFQKTNLKKRIWLVLIALILGLGLSAVQIIPNLEAIKYSYRETKDNTWSQVLNPKNLLHFEKKNFQAFSTILDPKINGLGNNTKSQTDYTETTVYVGPIALLLVIFSFYYWRKKIWLLNAAVAIVIFISLIFPSIKEVFDKIFPWLSTVSVWRFSVLMLFALSLLAGLGSEAVQTYNKKILNPLLIIATIILGVWQWQHILPFKDRNTLYPQTNFIAQIQNLSKNTRLWPKDSGLDQYMPYDIPIILGYDSVYPKTYLELWQANSQVIKPNQLHAKEVNEKLLKVTGASLMLTNKPLPENWQPILAWQDWTLAENNNIRPAIHAVNKLIPENSPSDLPNINPDIEALIIGDLPQIDGAAQAEIKIIGQSNNYLNLQTTSSGNSALVTNLQFYPGWQVFIDRKPATALQVNHAFLGSPIPAGEHQIEFKYSPKSFCLGIIVSSISVLFLLMLGIANKIRTKSQLGTNKMP